MLSKLYLSINLYNFWIYILALSLASIYIISIWYYIKIKYSLQPKQIRCLFGLILSVTSSLVAIPIAYNLWNVYFSNNMNLQSLLDYNTQYYNIYIICLFLATFFWDLVFGFIYFPNDMFIFSGIFHHIAYIIFLLYLIKVNACNLFLIALPEEIPTILISYRGIFPYHLTMFISQMFCLNFLLFRIIYHILGYCLLFYSSLNRSITYLWIPTSLTIFVHCNWYINWLRKHVYNLHNSSSPNEMSYRAITDNNIEKVT
ncbi:hypothetical protein ACR3K2_11570 [Cryptosporidium serpentis]